MKELRIKLSGNLQNNIEGYIDHICDEYKINDLLYGNILMTVVDFVDLIQQVKEESGLQEIYMAAYKEMGKLHMEIANHQQISFLYYINELQLQQKNDLLFLIRSLTDKLEFSESGDLINFTYNLDVDQQLKVSDRRNLLKEYLNTSNKNIRV